MNPEILSPHDEQYPPLFKQIFGRLLPPDIRYLGNLALLQDRGVGFCGSRKATGTGLKVAADCARQLADHGIVAVSGYAPGVDMAAHEASLAQGGHTIIVLAEGIDHFRLKKSIQPMWDWDRVLVLSYFQRNAIWRADRAMDRNKAIVALSDAVIVVEAREQGGTLNAGFFALQTKHPLFVAVYDDMNGAREGNRRLIAEGGIPLRKSRTSHEAQLRQLLEVVDKAA